MQPSRFAALAAVGSIVLAGIATQAGAAVATTTTTPAFTRLASSTAAVATLASGRKSAAAPSGLKPYAEGNGSRSLSTYNKAPAADQPAIGVVVVSVNWSQLESTKGTYTTAPIDSQIAAAAAKGLGVRLRVIAGTQAPAYVKSIGGTPIPFYDHQAVATTTIGRFWRTDYQARWQALMTYLAGKYDTNPTVREVNISGTGLISAEPMLTMGNDTIPGSSITNNARLVAAGATEAARRAALDNDITFMEKTWVHTHLTLFCHPYVTIEPSPKKSLATTEAIVSSTYKADPGHVVFGHTGASSTTFQGGAHDQTLEMYNFFIANHYPFMAQTQAYGGGAKNEGVGDLAYVMTWLADHGAYSTELPAGWQNDATALKALAPTTAEMIASATGSGH